MLLLLTAEYGLPLLAQVLLEGVATGRSLLLALEVSSLMTEWVVTDAGKLAPGFKYAGLAGSVTGS